MFLRDKRTHIWPRVIACAWLATMMGVNSASSASGTNSGRLKIHRILIFMMRFQVRDLGLFAPAFPHRSVWVLG
jgi:hypothetical protein